MGFYVNHVNIYCERCKKLVDDRYMVIEVNLLLCNECRDLYYKLFDDFNLNFSQPERLSEETSKEDATV